MFDRIVIRGARVHNLKNINLEIPRDKFVVITGLSGSGKSSLAFDTIYAEGQRRYVESLSAYARQFLGLMDKPDVDQIEGLSPAISIDQKSSSRNPRSTVGTITEIYDYLRLLFARVGHPHCPNCGREVARQSVSQIVDLITKFPANTRVLVMAPMVRDRKGEHRDVFAKIAKGGFVRVRLDGTTMELDEATDKQLDKQKKHTIEVVVDRLTIEGEGNDDRPRIADSVETALKLGEGVLLLHVIHIDHAPDGTIRERGQDQLISENFACVDCGISLPEIQPRNFSFNSPHGACPACTGLGTKLEVDEDLIIPNPSLTLAQGAIQPWSRTTGKQNWYTRLMEAVAKEHKFSMHTPVNKLKREHLKLILFGTGEERLLVKNPGYGIKAYETSFEGVVPNLERRHRETDSEYIRKEIERYMLITPCETCHGKRLKPEALSVTVAGLSIDKVVDKTILDAIEYFTMLAKSNGATQLSERERTISKQVLKEINARLQFLVDVGLSYLTLDRSATTLSGGEAQRIRLATQIGSSLVGVVYILDEPSIGLHQRDNAKLINTLKRLRDIGNTVIVVEHDEDTMREADHLIDIGPGAGAEGGEVVSQGTPDEIARDKKSLTGQYLSGSLAIETPPNPRRGNGKKLVIKGAREHNLKNVNVELPLGKFVAITGVSGSGKSTLVSDVLAKALAKEFHGAKSEPGEHDSIAGLEHLDKAITITQSPIGRTPRSNPATYTGLFTLIRDMFVQTTEAKIRGYKAGRFSFNVKGGRCEACAGDGLVRIEMHFLPDVYVECEECKGQRYNPEALEIRYKNKNIAEVLGMSVSEALNFFRSIPALKNKLQTLVDVGLGYIKLGQPATTLSGGEAQRIKLATELSRRSTGKTLYILDEPTTGLHFDDVKRLLHVLGKLVDKGNTVVVIEHNLDVIKCVDHVIDLGPEGGDAGGLIIATGTPMQVAKTKGSYTGMYLAKMFGNSKNKTSRSRPLSLKRVSRSKRLALK
ncbi:MAG: excinuclease ABC subunit UvrA [Candidatus Andersenbacteria bacterium]